MFHDDMWISSSPNEHIVSVHFTRQMELSLITEDDALYETISLYLHLHEVTKL